MTDPGIVTSIESLRIADPQVYEALQIVMAYMRNDMLPEEAQQELFAAMTPSTRRAIVAQFAGLDASVLMIFKEQLALINNVTRKVVTPEGVPVQGGENNLGISIKDAMNMSLKIVGMMTKDLPKVITLASVQRKEQALLDAVDTLPKAQQAEFLLNLERLEMEANKNG